jgi:hypothetical protein
MRRTVPVPPSCSAQLGTWRSVLVVRAISLLSVVWRGSHDSRLSHAHPAPPAHLRVKEAPHVQFAAFCRSPRGPRNG